MNSIEQKRELWAEIAKANGWHSEPFFVQVWIDKEGQIVDSVSFAGLDRDIIEAV